jgi:hypothetical protein
MFCQFASFCHQSEYDIAVIETQARRAVSVKVKQFSLQGTMVVWSSVGSCWFSNSLVIVR